MADDVRDAGQGAQGLRVCRGGAAGDDYAGAGIAGGETPDELAGFSAGFGGDAAGVHDAQVRLSAGAQAGMAKHGGKSACLALVDLAAQTFDDKLWHSLM